MAKIESLLFGNDGFMRGDRSFLISVAHVQKIDEAGKKIIMQQAKVCPYLLRNAVIDRVNQAWSIDITKLGFLYLTAIIDWYSSCIVGWEVDDTLDTRIVINALKKAIKIAKPVILNSDQGCQFTSNEYRNFVQENGISQSMDGKSRWADNIMIELWFRSFKYEEEAYVDGQVGKLTETVTGIYLD